jgi:hypothetical protein
MAVIQGYRSKLSVPCAVQDERLVGSQAQVLSAARAAGVQGFAVKSACEADWHEVCGRTMYARPKRPS